MRISTVNAKLYAMSDHDRGDIDAMRCAKRNNSHTVVVATLLAWMSLSAFSADSAMVSIEKKKLGSLYRDDVVVVDATLDYSALTNTVIDISKTLKPDFSTANETLVTTIDSRVAGVSNSVDSLEKRMDVVDAKLESISYTGQTALEGVEFDFKNGQNATQVLYMNLTNVIIRLGGTVVNPIEFK